MKKPLKGWDFWAQRLWKYVTLRLGKAPDFVEVAAKYYQLRERAPLRWDRTPNDMEDECISLTPGKAAGIIALAKYWCGIG